MKKIIIGIIIAFIFWFILFSPLTKNFVNFWVGMILATGILTIYTIILDKKHIMQLLKTEIKWIYIGIFSAIILYFIFFVGYFFSTQIFSFASKQVDNIYSIKNQSDKLLISIALFFWIGPAEEIFWRGLVQGKLSYKYGQTRGFIFTTLLYAIIHIWSFNFLLFMAALICGIFWGWMFKKYNSLVPIIISHSLWDVLIFVVIPIT